MESLEELKAIIDNAPEGATHVKSSPSLSDVIFYYRETEFTLFFGYNGKWFEQTNGMPSTRSLSDIERIIELEEKLNNSEPKKEECKHPSSTASYTHVTCDSCYMIRTDGGWGCASRKWFDNIESAKFYEKNGFLPR